MTSSRLTTGTLTTGTLTTGTLTTEQRNTYRAASRQLHAAGFQIRLPAWMRNTERRLVARKLRAGRTTQLTLELSFTTGTPIALASWTFKTKDDTRYFPLGQAEQAVAAAIQTAEAVAVPRKPDCAPRTWTADLPDEPTDINKITDCEGLTWTRGVTGNWVHESGLRAWNWRNVLWRRGPLTEVTAQERTR